MTIHKEKLMTLQAGFACEDITPEIRMEIPGGFTPRVSEGVSKSLKARAAALRDGDAP